MPNYDRVEAQRFSLKGMVTYLPPDRMPPGKYPLTINARAYLGDAISPRLPQSANLLSGVLPSLIHSLRRLDDTTAQPTLPTTNGPNGCGNGTDTSAPGIAWSNPGNITANDGNFATASLGAGGSGNTSALGPGTASGGGWVNPNNIKILDSVYATYTIGPGGTTGIISGTTFGFSIPSNASILGIIAKVVHNDITGNGTLRDSTVQLLKAGVAVGSNKAAGVNWNSIETFTYGSSSDLWGTTWTPADINNAGFGLRVNVHNFDTSPAQLGIDFISLQIFYTTPGIPSDFLVGNTFGFALGGGVQVAGILVEIKGFQSNTASTGQITVAMLKAGVAVGAAKSTVMPGGNAFFSLGSNSDLWGSSWLPADINNATFGVQIQASNTGGTGVTFSVDFVRITVYGFASGAPVNFVYVSGAADKVFVNTLQVASGMSGKRLAMVPFRPNTSVAPWMYIGDSAKLIKVRSDGTTYKTGIAEGTTLPTLALSGAGPLTGNYSYAGVYRSSKTGAQSNPTPTAHSVFITAAANSISVTFTASTEPQVDLIDVYRFGGALLSYTYVTTILNATPQYVDNLSDASVGANPIMSFSNYEPFPSIDIPRTGTLTTTTAGAPAGTVNITWASGDQFNTRWTYGTIISVSQTGSTQVTNLIIFARPSSATTMIAQIQPVGSTLPNGTYTFTITGAILAAQPLPALWGPTDNTAFMFACQDPLRPGTLYFTTGNNPDAAAQTNSIEITSPAEPLIGGCIVGGLSLCMSAEHGWLAYPNFAQVTATIVGVVGSPFSTVMSIADRGLITKEGICTDGGGMAFFIAKDSIRASPMGVGSYSITDEIYNLFPHDGQPQQYYRIAGFQIAPPDYTQPDGMALRFSQGYVYFDYIGIDNNRYTLFYDAAHSSVATSSDNFVSSSSWGVDKYANIATIHADNPGMFISSSSVPIGPLLGCADGSIRQLSPAGLENASMTVLTPGYDNGDQRAQKHFGDLYLETTSPTIPGAFALTCYSGRYQNAQTIAPTTIPASIGTRVGSVIELNSGLGIYDNDIELVITLPVNSVGCVLHLWQPSTLPEPETTGQRVTDWNDGGVPGDKFYQGVVVEADTGGALKNFAVQTENGITKTLAEVGTGIAFPGRQRIAFSLAVPVVSHAIRLLPLDTVPWKLYSLQWVWKPYPEQALEWHSEAISHGLEGYQHIGDMNIAHISTADITLTLRPDVGPSQSIVIPNSGGAQVKVLVTPPAFKFKLVGYHFTSSAPFRLWKEDIEVLVGQWGRAEKYQLVRPFGGESQEGAEV